MKKSIMPLLVAGPLIILFSAVVSQWIMIGKQSEELKRLTSDVDNLRTLFKSRQLVTPQTLRNPPRQIASVTGGKHDAVASKSNSTAQIANAGAHNLASRKLCAEQAKRTFDEDGPDPNEGETRGFTNHFNASTGKCAIEIQTINLKTETETLFVEDAFERRSYGFYIGTLPHDGRPDKVRRCSVTTLADEHEQCASREGFIYAVAPYMGSTSQ